MYTYAIPRPLPWRIALQEKAAEKVIGWIKDHALASQDKRWQKSLRSLSFYRRWHGEAEVADQCKLAKYMKSHRFPAFQDNLLIGFNEYWHQKLTSGYILSIN